ncbi:hypothetical protein Tco_0976867 [Tanacetum coccineum]|uniref:Reverse transcriptase domain-containing protein n=1 Tax=Tanacetum coccineum TaxID=301880 RepID=A0ABQ5EIG7_9ASTR
MGPGRTSAPAGQAQGGPSPAFVKENIDVLRTMIKELDNRGQEKVTPRKLFNEESGGAGWENSQMGPSAEEVGGYSSDGSSRSRSRGRPQSAQKHQRGVSRKKGISKSHQSVRSEAQSRSKSKSVKLKPRSVRASRRKSSSDSGYDTVSDIGSEDLSMPYRRPKPMPFTSKITRFRYHRRAKLPPNVRVRESGPSSEERRLQIQPKSSDLLGRKRVLEILAIDYVNFPPPPLIVGTPEKRNMKKFCDYHQDQGHNTNDCYHLKKQIEEAVASGRLAQLVKDIRQGSQKGKGSAKGKDKVINMVRSQGYRKRPYERVEH